ncbi:MAG: recombinase family protein, partial [Acetobacteraceae bacterium]|nr:recombinase family protein [Acetobacteraceae bacterium]
MALVGYARVSTAEQSLALQRDALKSAGCEVMFEDHASGAKAERRGLAEALSYLRRGDTLVTWKLDRLGRSMAHLIETVRGLEARGVGFRSLTEGIDTTTPGGTLIFHIFGALAQFERDLIRERTGAGLKAAEERGKKGGRKPVITPDKLARARAYIAAGLTVREAAARMKVGKTALYEALGGRTGRPKASSGSKKRPAPVGYSILASNISGGRGLDWINPHWVELAWQIR